jgi:hypothetical protein
MKGEEAGRKAGNTAFFFFLGKNGMIWNGQVSL